MQGDPNACSTLDYFCEQCNAVSYCLQLFQHGIKGHSRIPASEELREGFLHYKRLEDLESAASNGCHLCSLLLSKFDTANLSDPAPLNPICDALKIMRAPDSTRALEAWWAARSFPGNKYPVQFAATGSQLIVRVYFNRASGGSGGLWLAIADGQAVSGRFARSHLRIGQNAHVRDYYDKEFLEAQTALSTMSRGTMLLARRWLSGCLGQHQLCREAYQTASAIPTRLLDVRGSKREPIRLVYTKDAADDRDEMPEYLTLSHRWGTAQILCLTRENQDSFLHEIPWENLPNTFKDAVNVTRSLGYAYLWIDSLCVLQDTPHDWEEESAIMGDIYIAAACALLLHWTQQAVAKVSLAYAIPSRTSPAVFNSTWCKITW